MTAQIIRLPDRPPIAPAALEGPSRPADIVVLPLPASRAPAVALPRVVGADNTLAATAALLAACRGLLAHLDRIGQRGVAPGRGHFGEGAHV